MFVDYYELLDIQENATQKEIAMAYKKQAIKWHPDRNSGQDTTLRMQMINEAYLILKDKEARSRYDVEYQRYKSYCQQQEQTTNNRNEDRPQDTHREANPRYEYNDYQINDDILFKWINNARKQAVELAKQTLEDLTGMIKEGTKASIEGCVSVFCFIIIINIIVVIVRSCNA